mgnify:CR=1 FL=1
MNKQLIIITAPFNCGHCTKAVNELPAVCEEHGWEFIEMPNEKGNTPEDELPVTMYPTIMFRVKEQIVSVSKGYNKSTVLKEIKNY